MPWTLWRYILSDLLRSFALTAFVLVTVIAFGAAIKPLAQDHLFGAWQAMKYILLAMVPMLQFALPFAGGFAATITLHRMASDREVIAAVVGGISYTRLLAPVIALGVVVTLVLAILTQSVIPRFWTMMERTITADIVGMFEASIGRGLPFRVGDRQIYADSMSVVHEPEGSAANTRIRLLRLAAIELGDEGEVVFDIVAHQAAVDVYFRDGHAVLQFVLEDSLAYDATSRTVMRAPRTDPGNSVVVPGFLDNDPSAHTRAELIAMQRQPDLYPPVRQAADELAQLLRLVDEWTLMRDALARDGYVTLHDPDDEGESYRIASIGFDNGRFITERGRPVIIEHRIDGQRASLLEAASAEIVLNDASTVSDLIFDLVARDVVVATNVDGVRNERAEVRRPGLVPPASPTAAYAELSSSALLDLALPRKDQSSSVAKRIENLQRRILEVNRETGSHLAKRYALSATAVLLISLGAMLAILLRESPPLTVYLWAFLPSVLDLVLISGGEMMINDKKSGGYIVIWSGNGLLLVLCAVAYRRLTRN